MMKIQSGLTINELSDIICMLLKNRKDFTM